MSMTSERAKQVRDSVAKILEQHPETRDDDRHLLLRFWNEVDQIHFDYTFPQKFAEQATSAESITRARRQLQQSGMYKSSEESSKMRQQRQAELREHFAKGQ